MNNIDLDWENFVICLCVGLWLGLYVGLWLGSMQKKDTSLIRRLFGYLSYDSSMHISAHLFVPIPLFTDMFCYFLYKRYYPYHFSTSCSPTCYIINIHSYRHPCPTPILYLHYHPFSRAAPLFAHKNTAKTFVSTVFLSFFLH